MYGLAPVGLHILGEDPDRCPHQLGAGLAVRPATPCHRCAHGHGRTHPMKRHKDHHDRWYHGDVLGELSIEIHSQKNKRNSAKGSNQLAIWDEGYMSMFDMAV